jgi:hypothetical protein
VELEIGVGTCAGTAHFDGTLSGTRRAQSAEPGETSDGCRRFAPAPHGVDPMSRFALLACACALATSGCSDKEAKNTGQQDKNEKKSEWGGMSPQPPCHPGCFPAGALVDTPTGPRAVDALRAGDPVTLVSTDGTAVSGPVRSTFCTDNRLFEVRTDAGTLRTTSAQPLCLVAGGFRTVGDLKAGDAVWRWTDGKRAAARVLSITDTGTDAPVFNIVVGESAVFVAGGYLARGKPPLE